MAATVRLNTGVVSVENVSVDRPLDDTPLITEYIPVNYSNAGSEILPHIQNILTENRGKISVDVRNNQIILTDTAEKIAEAIDTTVESILLSKIACHGSMRDSVPQPGGGSLFSARVAASLR
mgnify:CR=1 FL=1